jgi:hypothetical protein
VLKLVVSANWKPLFVEKHHHHITFMFIKCLSTIAFYLVMVSQIRLTSIYYEVFENVVIVAVQNVSCLEIYQNNILKKLTLIHQNDMKI